MHSLAAFLNGCAFALTNGFLIYQLITSFCRDYYAALLRTNSSFVAPTQGKLLNYVQRVPLGVVAQITVGLREV